MVKGVPKAAVALANYKGAFVVFARVIGQNRH
jgi:hypothetical protein